MRLGASILPLCCVALVTGCCCHRKESASTQPVALEMRDVAGNPAIVHIVSRNHIVTISASPRGPLYSVKNPQGQALMANLTLDELHARHPEIYRQIAPAIATARADDDRRPIVLPSRSVPASSSHNASGPLPNSFEAR